MVVAVAARSMLQQRTTCCNTLLPMMQHGLDMLQHAAPVRRRCSYRKSHKFHLDLLSLLPIDFIVVFTSLRDQWDMFRLLRLLR